MGPLLFEIPLFVYGIWLFRGVSKTEWICCIDLDVRLDLKYPIRGYHGQGVQQREKIQDMNKRLVISIVVLVIYMAIIMVGAKIEVGSGTMSQAEMVSRQISTSLIVALVFLFGVVAIFGWRRDAGLTPVRSAKSLLILWLPGLFILGFFGLGLLLGYPTAQAFLFVGINTLIVGITEELAFRGILFSGARSALRPIGAITLTSIIFGAVHVFNGFTTGDWTAATVQATAAGMSGLLFYRHFDKDRFDHPGNDRSLAVGFRHLYGRFTQRT